MEHCGCVERLTQDWTSTMPVCVKRTTGACLASYTGGCPIDMTYCEPGNVHALNAPDTPGKWANRKCAKKVRKGKCNKKKVRKNCNRSCGLG